MQDDGGGQSSGLNLGSSYSPIFHSAGGLTGGSKGSQRLKKRMLLRELNGLQPRSSQDCSGR